MTARAMLSHRALNRKLDELETQERWDIAGLARNDAEQRTKLDAPKKKIARAGADVYKNFKSRRVE